jgi:hypothetical protein
LNHSYVVQLCHRAGFEQSYHEVGRPDAAILASTGNAASNGAGIWVPPVSLLLRRAFGGSRVPHLLVGGAAKIATALFYCRFVTLTPARCTLVPAADADARGEAGSVHAAALAAARKAK